MDIISVVNTMQPDTIARLALDQQHLPNGVPFMGAFVILFPGAVLPDPAAVSAYEPTYLAGIAAQQQNKTPDLVTQVANLTQAVAALGGALPAAQVSAATTVLAETQVSLGVATKLGV